MIRRPRFDPRTIPGLELWFDASAASTITLGTGVSGWADLSGNARNATQTAVNSQPAWTQNALGNRPVLTFDGLNDCLSFAPLSLSAWTIFIVCSRTAGVTNASLLQVMQSAYGVESALAAINDSATAGPLLVGSGSTGTTTYGMGGSLSAGTARVLSATWDGTGINGSTYYALWDGGTSVTLSSSSAIPKASGPDSLIGASWSQGLLQGFFRGQIGEIRVYSSALGSDARVANERDLIRKWGL